MSRAPRRVNGQSPARARANSPVDPASYGTDDEPNLVLVRTLLHETATRLANLKREVDRGERIDRARLRLQQTTAGRRFRDALLQLPDRHALEGAARMGVDGKQLKRAMEAVIDAELRRIAAAARGHN
jgi:hypothetical protein